MIRSIHDLLVLAARSLGDLRDEVVFVGGATTGLLLTDPAAPKVRATKDIDVIVEVASKSEYYKLGDRLRERGFAEDQSKGAPICRWTLGEDLILDVMPTMDGIVGFSNRWYPDALRNASALHLEPDLPIRVVTAPYYCATKLEAFHDRGQDDVMGSHDLEDFVAVVDGRPELRDEVSRAGEEVRRFLAEESASLLANIEFLDSVAGFVPSDEGRAAVIVERLHSIAERR